MELAEIIREMNSLPRGTLVYKKIKGKEQPYLQWTENGKSKSRYIKKEEREKIFKELNRREYLKNEFDRLTIEILKDDDYSYVSEPDNQYNARNEQPLISKKMSKNCFTVERNYINSKAYHDKFEKLPVSKNVYERLYIECGRLLNDVDGSDIERMIAINARTGDLIVDNLSREAVSDHTSFNEEEYDCIEKTDEMIILIHNHSYNRPPSGRDIATYAANDIIKLSLIVCHDGDVYAITNAVSEVADIYEMYYKELKEKYDDKIAGSIATSRLEKLNMKNKLYEIRRL